MIEKRHEEYRIRLGAPKVAAHTMPPVKALQGKLICSLDDLRESTASAQDNSARGHQMVQLLKRNGELELEVLQQQLAIDIIANEYQEFLQADDFEKRVLCQISISRSYLNLGETSEAVKHFLIAGNLSRFAGAETVLELQVIGQELADHLDSMNEVQAHRFCSVVGRIFNDFSDISVKISALNKMGHCS